MGDFDVTDTGRLVHAGAGLDPDLADAFVVELDPALEHIEQLHLQVVSVPAAAAVLARLGADHVGADVPAGRRLDAEVAVLEEGPEPLALVLRILQVRNGELRLGFGRGHGGRAPCRLDRGIALAGRLAERLADEHLLDAIVPSIHYIPATMTGSTR